MRAAGGASIGGYVPGAAPALFPKELGVLIKQDSDFRFQVHYTPNGKAATVVTRVGLWVTDEAPQYALQTTAILDPCLTIPANTKAYTASMSRTIDNSTLNLANPDPSIVVHWGEQTWEEMLYGSISFRYADEAHSGTVQRSAQAVPK